jgi:hypothetical protein
MVAPAGVGSELLQAREVEYLAGRKVPDVPGLHLRQDSAGPVGLTTTTWVTATATVTGGVLSVTPFPGATGQAGNGNGDGNGGGGLGIVATETDTIMTTTTVPAPVLPTAAPIGLGDLNGDDGITSLMEMNQTEAPSRPWMVTRSTTVQRHRPSFIGFMLWATAILALDIYINTL